MTDVEIGLAGVGYWGSKLARNIDEAFGSRLAAVADVDPKRLADARSRYPECRDFDDVARLVRDPALDAVVVATSASQHAAHARLALEAGKHVLVEKPLALTSAECDGLCELAAETGCTLMVGHTFIYSEPVRYLRALIETGELGRVLYVYAQRLNLGIVREDLNALWNFGPHDVSIMLYLLGASPERVSALQYSLLDRHLEDVAFLVLEFPNGVVAHVHESWLDPRKVRHLTVVGDRKMAVYDDTDVETPIRIYDKGVIPEHSDGTEALRLDTSEHGFGEFKLKVRAGDMLAPHIAAREPLRIEIEHFVDCVAHGTPPETSGEHGREVVAILEAADRSARQRGATVSVVEAAPSASS